MKTIAAAALLLIAGPALAQSPDTALAARVERLLSRSPVIDGHNDLPWELRNKYPNGIDLAKDTAALPQPLDTDIPRLRQGHVGAQFWSVWIPATITGPVAVTTTLEQIDIVRRFVAAHPTAIEMASTAADVRRIEKAGRIASLIGVEGGHQIDNSLAVLRQYHALGVRYMTLTHTRNIDWADSGTDDPKANGLTPFGVAVVREMNRIGMMVDLSHVSAATMVAAIRASRAPVIFSHSNARALIDHPRGVPDDVLAMVKANGGVVMVNFYPPYVADAARRHAADRAAEVTRTNAPPYAGLYIGQPDRAAQALKDWDAAHPAPVVPITAVADHIDHIVKVAGHDHVGIGSDFDGIDTNVAGLDGVEDYPALFVELARRGWSEANLARLSGGNILRVMAAAETVAASLKDEPAAMAALP